MSDTAIGQVDAVYTRTVGDVLTADAHSGDATITVEDTSNFDPDGGWLRVAGQVVQYTAIDEDTGVITLATPLT